MKYLLLMTLIFSQFVYANGGDGTLPVIRTINVEFDRGNLRQMLKLPKCVNMQVKHSDIKAGKLTKKLNLKNVQLKQRIVVRKRQGITDVTVASSLGNTRQLQSNVRGLSETQFLNEIEVEESTLIQAINLNEMKAGCTNL